MVKMYVEYAGEKHCELRHEPSGSCLETDAPRDNQGKGERFSPTDLMGAALGSCILTTMAIAAERDDIDLTGAKAEVQKEMVSSPRRIGSLSVKITLPASLSREQRQQLEQVGKTCPVQKSLHGDVRTPIEFIYK